MLFKSRYINPLFLTIGICLLGTGFLVAQEEVHLTNGSFEDYPRQGNINPWGMRTPAPAGWFDCGAINFPHHTPPDVHPNVENPYWEVNVQASKGQTYLGLVVRADESWESVSQNLEVDLKGGECYKFSIDLYRSPDYWSQIYDDGSAEVRAILGGDPTKFHNHITPAVLRLWGGKTYCAEGELLASSAPVENSFWKRYSFKIEPSFDYSHITLEAFYDVPVLSPYLGHILVDNATTFTPLDCEVDKEEIETIEDIVIEEEIVEVVETPKTPSKPEPKPKPEAETVIDLSDPVEEESQIVLEEVKKEKILKDLDHKMVKKGQIIEVRQLQFKADDYLIDSSSFDVLDEIYDFLAFNERIEIEIGGHTNGMPPHHYCDELSLSRAQAVADVLVHKGIEQDRISVKGYGKRQPKYSNSTTKGRAKNQRVELKILKLE